MESIKIQLTINGKEGTYLVKPWQNLADFLRNQLGLKGTKVGCDGGECGMCAVWINGRFGLSCTTLVATLSGSEIWTIEGMQGREWEVLKQAFVEEGATQCGFCTPSMMMVLTWILKENPQKDILPALSGQFCRCTGYGKIIKAYEKAYQTLYPTK